MGHYAKIENDVVVDVIVADYEFAQTLEGEWIKTSYNTRGNQHFNGKEPLRGNFAGIGCTYDRENDVFIEPKPFDSWVLDTNTWSWEPPIPHPEGDIIYLWDEDTLSWIKPNRELL